MAARLALLLLLPCSEAWHATPRGRYAPMRARERCAPLRTASDDLAELRCLYVQQNLIAKVQGLAGLDKLRVLDLSQNRLTHLEGLACLPSLETLNVSKNSLASPDAVRELVGCPESMWQEVMYAKCASYMERHGG